MASRRCLSIYVEVEFRIQFGKQVICEDVISDDY